MKYDVNHAFKKELSGLLNNYVGRPTPLYFAKRLSNITVQTFISNERFMSILITLGKCYTTT